MASDRRTAVANAPGVSPWVVYFSERVLSAFAAITERGHNVVAIVSHGGPIKAILRHLNMPIPNSIGDGEIIAVDLAV